MRFKYPHIFHGALASSAPITFFEGGVSPYGYNQATTESFGVTYPECPDILREAFRVLVDWKDESGNYDEIQSAFNLCRAPQSADEVLDISGYANGVMGNLVMVNYPYPSDYLAPLPGYPVDAGC